MDKDRVLGSAKEAKGKLKEAVGRAVGYAKLETEGTADKVGAWCRTPSVHLRT